jgi:hypothetical protein
LKPEVLNKIREKHAATTQRERERTLAVIPEWSDESRREADLSGMVEHLTRAGFPESYLSQVSDHRTMAYIRTNMLREQRINQALDMVKPKVKAAHTPSHKGDTARAATNRPSAPQTGRQVTNQVSQISQLLNSRGK